MRKRQRLTALFALVGFVVAIVIYASSRVVHNSETPGHMEVALGVVSVLLCPPALLAVPLFDIEPNTIPGAILWAVIAAANSGLYAIIGALIGRLFWKGSHRSDLG